MSTKEIERMNILSKKTLSLKATPEELNEFYKLFDIINKSDTHNVVLGLPR
jgi:uncharacterized protein YnzC (UPF0291/DUF896 family)